MHRSQHMSEPSSIALDRRSFIKAGAALAGSLIIDFAIPLGECPAFAQTAPAPFAPNAFIRIDRQGVVTLVMRMAEMGQGVSTAMAMLLAEELELGLDQVRLEHAPPDDALYANAILQSQTTGLSSTIRAFWIPLRQAGAVARSMLIAAAAKQWSVDGNSCQAQRGAVVHPASSRRLTYGELVDMAATLPIPARDSVVLKPLDAMSIIGTSAKRIEGPEKVNGRTEFGIDVRLPGMKIAAIAVSPVLGGRAKLVNERAALAVRGVRQVVNIDEAVAVVADHMWAAKKGLKAAAIEWDDGPNAAVDMGTVVRQLEEAAAHPGAVARNVDVPVKVIWTREEDIRHGMYRPYYYDRVSAGLDANGHPIAWTHRIAGSSVVARYVPSAFKDGLEFDVIDCAAKTPYAFPNMRVEYVRVEPPGIQTAFCRGVGLTHNVFVVASFTAERAQTAKQDPFPYRKAHATDPRAIAVLTLAAEKADWGRALPARRGRGISLQFAFGSYSSTVVEVEVALNGSIRVHRLVCAADCGIVVNPDTLAAQFEGGTLFGLTAALYGAITLKNGRVEQSNFHDYRPMRMNECPVIDVHLVKSTEAPGGVGETPTSAIAPAVTNAIFAATRVRIRTLPIDPALLKSSNPGTTEGRP